MRPILNGILLLFLSLGAFTVPGAWAQQTTDNAHAKIWHRALLWIYEDNNKTVGKNAQKPAPQVSSESVAQFEKELAAASKANQDDYNFYTRLYQPVQAKLAKEKAVLDKAMIDAIVAEAAKKSDRKTEDLRFALETVASENTSTIQQNIPAEEPENVLIPDTNTTENIPVKEENYMSYISVLALLLAVFALWRTFRKSSHRAVSVARIPEKDIVVAGKTNHESPNVKALKRELESLRKSYQQLKTENENWRADVQNAIQELQKTAYAATPVSSKYDLVSDNATSQIQPEAEPEFNAAEDTYEVDTNHLFAEETQTQNQVKYTRVPEDGQIKDREMHHDSRETWSFIEVAIPDSQSNTATFRINPYVNHALAINNSLDRLENAFEFVRSANKATQIINDADGELVRTAQGWQITKRAKIHLA